MLPASMQSESYSAELGCTVLGSRRATELRLQVADNFGQLALSSLGPNGRSKVLQASEDTPAGVITSVGNRLFTGLRLNDPVSQLLLQATVLPQTQRYGDGGLLALHIACTLVRHALDTAQTQAARLELGRAYQDAAAFVAELLGQAWQEPAAQGSTSSAKSHTSLSSAKNDAAGPAATAPEAAAVVRDVASIFGGPRQGSQPRTSPGTAAATTTSSRSSSCTGLHPSSLRQEHQLPQEGGGSREPYLGRLCLSLSGAGASAYVALVRGVLSTKQACGLGPGALSHASLLLVQSFVSALPSPAPQSAMQAAAGQRQWTQPGDGVRLVVTPGLTDPKEWEVILGLLLDQAPSPTVASLLQATTSSHHHRHHHVVALFDVSLEPSSAGSTSVQSGSTNAAASTGGVAHGRALSGVQLLGAQVVVDERPQGKGEEGWSAACEELRALLALVDELKRLGVTLIACQKIIHEEVVAYAASLGIPALQRLSARHAAHLAALSGALPISAPHSTLLSQPNGARSGNGQQGSQLSQCLGLTGAVTLRHLAHRTSVHIAPFPLDVIASLSTTSSASAAVAKPWQAAPQAVGRMRPVVTCLLGAAGDMACDELKAAAEGALKVLNMTARVPYVLPGGGGAEALIAAQLRAACAAGVKGRHMQGSTGPSTAAQADAWLALAGALEDATVSIVAPVPGLSRTEVREAVMSLPEHLQDQLQALQASTSKGSTTQQPGVVELLGWDAAQAAFVPVVKAHARRLQQHSSFKQANNPAAKLESGPMEVAGSVLEPELLDSLPAKLAAVTAGVDAAALVLRIDGVLIAS